MPTFKTQSGFAPIILVIGLLSVSAIAAGAYYTMNQKPPVQPVIQTQPAPVEGVKETHETKLLEMDGVSAVQVGEKDEKPCIVVFSFKETEELESLESNGLDGYEVVVENSAQN